MSNPIKWCDETLNVTVGCSPVSSGCDNCYAARMASRFRNEGEQFWGLTGEFFDECDESGYSKGPFNGTVDFHPERLEKPFHWKRPRRIFVNSMGDLFHERVTNEQIAAVLGVIAATPRHTYMILTKRPERMVEWFQWIREYGANVPFLVGEEIPPGASGEAAACVMSNTTDPDLNPIPINEFIVGVHQPWPLPNLWLGVSVEDQPTADVRLAQLFKCPSAKYFVSYEPGIGPVDFNDLTVEIKDNWEHHIDALWCDENPEDCGEYGGHVLDLVICGAETGPGKRPMNLDWARSVRDQCAASGVPFWFKKDSDGNETLDGVEHKPEFWK